MFRLLCAMKALELPRCSRWHVATRERGSIKRNGGLSAPPAKKETSGCPPLTRTNQRSAVAVAAVRGSAEETPFFSREEPDESGPAERFVAEVVYALLSASAVGVPAAAVLPKFHASMTEKSYTSALVALGRKQAWDIASQVAVWVRQQGLLLPAESYLCLAQRRAEQRHWDHALDPIAWMRDHGCPPTGETVLTVARIIMDGMPHMQDRDRLRELVAWLRTSDAGRALWTAYVPDGPTMAAADATTGPAWRSQGVAIESGSDIMHAPLNELKTTLASIVEAAHASARPQHPEHMDPSAITVNAGQPEAGSSVSEIDLLLGLKGRLDAR